MLLCSVAFPVFCGERLSSGLSLSSPAGHEETFMEHQSQSCDVSGTQCLVGVAAASEHRCVVIRKKFSVSQEQMKAAEMEDK